MQTTLFQMETGEPTIGAVIKELEFEIVMRKKVFGSKVQLGLMSEEAAKYRIGLIEYGIEQLHRLEDLER